VPKEKLAENGDYNLTGERYRVVERQGKQKWPMVKLGDVCEIERGASPRPIQKYITDDKNGINWIKIGDGSSNSMYITKTEEKITKDGAEKSRYVKADDFILSNSMSFGHPYILKIDGCIHDGWLALRNISNSLNKEYLYYLLSSEEIYKQFSQLATGGVVNNLNSNLVRNISIPLPSIVFQHEIVTEIEGYQKIIDGARQVADNWRPQIEVDPDWPMVKLGEVCEIKSGGTPTTAERENYDNGSIPWLKSEVCKNEIINIVSTYITKKGLNNSSAKMLKQKSTLIALVGATIGKTGFITFEAATNQNVAGLYPNDVEILSELFLFYSVQGLYDYFMRLGDGNFKMANISFIKSLEISLPSLEIQKEIVTKIEDERKIIDGCRELMVRYEEKIKRVVDGVWG
jgi:type I restriction enzyme M protein